MKVNTNRKPALEIIVEKNDDHFWGRVEDKGDFMPTGQGETIDLLIKNVKDSIEDYQENEGMKDKFWSKIDVNNVDFAIRYDLQAFFDDHEFLKISSIAKRAGINESLMRQYATGKKFPSVDQAKKIEDAIHHLAKELLDISIYA